MGLVNTLAARSAIKHPGRLMGAAGGRGKLAAHRPFEIYADRVMIGLYLIAPHIAAASIADAPEPARCQTISMPMRSNLRKSAPAVQSVPQIRSLWIYSDLGFIWALFEQIHLIIRPLKQAFCCGHPGCTRWATPPGGTRWAGFRRRGARPIPL